MRFMVDIRHGPVVPILPSVIPVAWGQKDPFGPQGMTGAAGIPRPRRFRLRVWLHKLEGPCRGCPYNKSPTTGGLC